MIITIDGPAGTGKSTVARRLAEELGWSCLDTGAMYRACALLSLQAGISPDNGPAMAAALDRVRLGFDFAASPPRLYLNDEDVTDRVRDTDVAGVVSIVAQQSEVRSVLIRQQRQIASEHPKLVTEGRDQGSVVFPDAILRFYLDASPEIRARRRADQMARAGRPVDLQEVLAQIEQRDELDSTRVDGPLICPEGAIRIDTTDASIEQVVAMLVEHADSRLQDSGEPGC